MARFFWHDPRAQEIQALEKFLDALSGFLYTQAYTQSLHTKTLHTKNEIERLFHAFHPGLQADLQDIQSLAHFSANNYTRLPIAGNDMFQLLLLSWKSGQFSPIHDHGQSVCAVKVLQGTATEITYGFTKRNTLLPLSSERFLTGEVTCSLGGDVHQFGNAEGDGENLITLHCYAPPLYDMKRFSLEDTVFASPTENLQDLPTHSLHEKVLHEKVDPAFPVGTR